MVTSRRAKRSGAKQRIMEAATHAVAATGAGALRVDEIAARSRVNKRMIYHYFGNRAGLIDAVLAAQSAILARHLDSESNRKVLLLTLDLAQHQGELNQSAPVMVGDEALRRAAAIVLCALLQKHWSEERPAPPSATRDWEGLLGRLLVLARPAQVSAHGAAVVEKPRYTVRSTSRPAE